MAEKYAGRCLCGTTQYEATGEPVAAVLCHCSMCRRAAGAPAVAWAMFASDQFVVTGGQIAKYLSSDGAERGFCSGCGTTLTFSADYLPGLVDVTISSLDDPSRLSPSMHIWESRRLDWFVSADPWPRHKEFPPQ